MKQETKHDPTILETHAVQNQHRFVIIGGGAGGLELTCKLSRKLGPGRVTLIESNLNHIWKPSLHEVAAGTLDPNQEGLSYLMLAHDNGFDFVWGPMTGLDAIARQVTVGAVKTVNDEPLLPTRQITYDSLVIAVGSTAHYFGILGAAEHAIALNDPQSAERFRLRMLRALAAADKRKANEKSAGMDIVIIGGGATGVELAAELREASKVLASYGFRRLDPDVDVRLTLLEGAERILPPLQDKVAKSATNLLKARHISVFTNCRVANISADVVEDASGQQYPANLCVWTAGIKAPDFLAQLGLPVARGGQLDVDSYLLVKGQSEIYALGDCAACTDINGNLVPPRAQTAHQQADYLLDFFLRRERANTPDARAFEYKDHGSLISLGRRSSVGSLMGSLFKSSWFAEGVFARFMYANLHLMHHQVVMGTVRTVILVMARFLVKRARPQVKLH